MFACCIAELFGDDSWLGDRDAIGWVDFNNLIHPHHGDKDAAIDGNAAAGVTCACCSSVDWDRVCRGKFDDV